MSASRAAIPDEGFVLEPGRLYLAATAEILGGTAFAAKRPDLVMAAMAMLCG